MAGGCAGSGGRRQHGCRPYIAEMSPPLHVSARVPNLPIWTKCGRGLINGLNSAVDGDGRQMASGRADGIRNGKRAKEPRRCTNVTNQPQVFHTSTGK